MNPTKTYQLLCLTVLLSSCLMPAMQAQHPFYYNIGSDQDLPSNEVYKIRQDSFGYIWIGCDAGLFRYDGFRFKGYSNRHQTGRSMSDLKFDQKGRLWCKNFNGQVLRVNGDSLEIMADFSKSCSTFPYFTITPDNNLWVSCYDELNVYTNDGKIIHKIKFPSKNPNTLSWDITELHYSNGWVYLFRAQEGMLRINPKTYEITPLYQKDVFVPDYTRINFHQATKDSCYVIMDISVKERFYRVCLLSPDSLIPLNLIYPTTNNSIIYNFKTDKQGNLGLCTSDGLIICPKNKIPNKLENKERFLPGQQISDMLQDREGNYWFTSLQNGIFVVPSMDILHYSTENSELPNSFLTKLHKSTDGSLYLGTHTGDVFQWIPSSKNFHTRFDKKNLSYRTVKAFCEKEDLLLVARNKPSLYWKQTKQYQDVRLGDVRDMLFVGDTLYYVLSRASTWTLANKHNFYHPDSIPISYPLSNTGGWALIYDSLSQNIWFALSNGIHIYKNQQFEPVLVDGQSLYGADLDYAAGIVWVGSLNNGLYGFKGGKLIYHFNTNNGLQNNSIKVVKAQGDWVWTTAANVLYRIHLPSKSIDIFTKNLGINAKDITDIAFVGDTVYLATHKGLFELPKNFVSFNAIKPSILIDAVWLNDSLLRTRDNLLLPYKYGQIRINFSSTAFRSRGSFHFEYRIAELDSAWTRLSAENNFAVYSSLSPGIYLFEVRAVNESGISSVQHAELYITVKTPFWQQWWFFILLSMLFIFLVLGVYQFQLKVATRRAELEKKLIASQLTALKAQMNPHFMFNALNSIQDLILVQDVKNANLYLSKFSNLMRSILKASGNDEILLGEELAILKLYLDLEKLRFGKELVFEFGVDENLELEKYFIPSMIIQPFVENAIKHGLLHKKGSKKLVLSFEKKEGYLVCIIEDNGVGRKRSKEIKERGAAKGYSSFATNATKKRLELINDAKNKNIGLDIIDLFKAGEAVGTRVILSIPYSLD